MKRLFKQETLLAENRPLLANIIVSLVLVTLGGRLWFIQVYKGDYYLEVSTKNRIRHIETPAARGLLYDRNGKVLLGNRPFYDLVYIPQYVHDKEKTFKIISGLIHLPIDRLKRSLRIGSGRPKYLPIVIKRNLSLHEVAIFDSNKIFLPGIEVVAVPRRDYDSSTPAHLVGYLAEIDPKTLQKLNEKSSHKYNQGDLVGKQGLESVWEEYLKGKSGYKLIQVDAYGRKSKPLIKDRKLPEVDAQKGNDIQLNIDLTIQAAVRKAFRGKQGAVIVTKVETGEVLALVSAPSYDPRMYQQQVSQDEWYALVNNPFKPLFDKTTGGEYIPGSIFKPIVAMAGLEEGVINPHKKIKCHGHYTLGNETFSCWEKGGHGLVNMRDAIKKSCDVYFYLLGVELGVDKIAEYARDLGLGRKLGLNLNMERAGLVPTKEWKKKTHGVSWRGGDTPNIAIGQGYNLLTPIQMVTLYATIANGGKVMQPQLVQQITNQIGDVIYKPKPQAITTSKLVSPKTFEIMRSYLEAVVMDTDGTGRNALVKGATVAGKTGSAQVVSLKKNSSNKNDDTSVKWKEHAIFAAFSPTEKAEISVIIVSENDSFGGGGSQAAPIAQKIIQAYWNQKNIKIATKPKPEVKL